MVLTPLVPPRLPLLYELALSVLFPLLALLALPLAVLAADISAQPITSQVKASSTFPSLASFYYRRHVNMWNQTAVSAGL